MLPFESCRKQTSAKAHVLGEGGIDAAQPASITFVTALLHSCGSFPALSCGNEEAAAGARRKNTQRMFAILGFLFSCFQCFGTIICQVLPQALEM